MDGKTGPRTVRLVKSTPTLANWLSIHPFKDDPDAFVWINLLKNHFGEQLNYPAARAMVNRRARIAHLEKRVNLNMFRHSEATNSAKFMTEAQLRKRHGWSPESKMPAKYVHMINADVDAAIFEHLGIETKEKEENNLPKICHVCNVSNSSESEICSKCGKPLDLQIALIKEEEQQKIAEKQEQKMTEMEEKMQEMQKEMIMQRSSLTFFKAQIGIPTQISLQQLESQKQNTKSAVLAW